MAIIEPFNNESLNDVASVGLLTTALPMGGYLLNKSENYGVVDKLTKFSNSLVGSDYLNNQLNRTIVSTTGSQLLSNSEQALQKILLSQFMALEEASPLHILRTLQLSNFLQPFTPLVNNDNTIHITPNSVRNQQHYYESLIKYVTEDEQRKIKRKLEVKDLTRGFFFKNNTLYGSTIEGGIDLNDVVIKNARLSLSSIKNGEIYSQNRIVEKFAQTIGSSINVNGSKVTPLLVVGAKDNLDFSKKWMDATLRFSMDVGFKTLDNPLAGIEEMFGLAGAEHTSLFKNKYWEKVREFSGKLQLGTNGNYNLSIKDSIKLSAKNIAVKGSLAYIGYQGIDSALRMLSPDDGIFSQGLGTGLANIYASSRIAFAKVWSDRFQGYKERQEQSAPGSTNITSLLAFPLAGALAGAQVAYFNRVGVSLLKGSETASNIYNVEKESKVLKDTINLDTKLKPMKRNALIGGLIGGALSLPFLPGALIGSSSEELEQLYSGQKEIKERANKGWLFGGGAFEGGATKYHTKNWVARMRADATDKVRYGDDETKKSMNPFLHPFSYLKDPYKFEKRNADTMPYPVWGMDVGYGSFFGKIFERTIGQIIKPDVINPAYKDAILKGTPETPVEYTNGSTVSLISTTEEVLHAKQNIGKSFIKASKNLFNSKQNKTLIGVNNKDSSLIKDGLMVMPNTPSYDPDMEAIGLSYKALMDFTGIKGWTSSLVIDGLGLEPGVNSLQLARSGEANSAARDLLEQNLGDTLGLGEFQRKILPTSSASLPDRFNPITNNAPSWLPSDKNKYFVDFKHGNMYGAIERGEERLPGVGYESLYPELKGMSSEDYPLVYKHKILSNVAKGSEEFINARKQAIDAYKNNKLSKEEVNILGNTLEQEVEREQKKDFYETPNKLQGPLGSIHNALWEGIRSISESPLEMLTPVRPVAKFLHKRTAIEDYIETQLGGSDTAIWTNPYSHFIKPAINKTIQSTKLSGTFIPEETKEKYNIDEYFDKFKYLKARRSNSEFQADSTVIGASLSGLNTKEKVLKFKRGLQDEQKDYFDSFSKETDEKKRDKIRSILPNDVLRGYEQIWQNIDIANKARKNGSNIQEALADNMDRQTNRLKDLYNVSLSKEDKILARSKVRNNSDNYVDQGISNSNRVKYTENEILRRKMADKESLTYLASKTGVPNTKFIGWDPRLTTDDIKIRTLSIGGEDLKRFGFWKKDEERMNRLSGIVNTKDVFNDIDQIKEEIKSDRRIKNNIERVMFRNGFKSSKIDLVDSNYNNILVRED